MVGMYKINRPKSYRNIYFDNNLAFRLKNTKMILQRAPMREIPVPRRLIPLERIRSKAIKETLNYRNNCFDNILAFRNAENTKLILQREPR
jgi:hypothetical protein